MQFGFEPKPKNAKTATGKVVSTFNPKGLRRLSKRASRKVAARYASFDEQSLVGTQYRGFPGSRVTSIEYAGQDMSGGQREQAGYDVTVRLDDGRDLVFRKRYDDLTSGYEFLSLTGNLDPRRASSARRAVIDEHFAELDPKAVSSVAPEDDMTDEEARDWWTDQGIDQSREGRRKTAGSGPWAIVCNTCHLFEQGLSKDGMNALLNEHFGHDAEAFNLENNSAEELRYSLPEWAFSQITAVQGSRKTAGSLGNNEAVDDDFGPAEYYRYKGGYGVRGYIKGPDPFYGYYWDVQKGPYEDRNAMYGYASTVEQAFAACEGADRQLRNQASRKTASRKTALEDEDLLMCDYCGDLYPAARRYTTKLRSGQFCSRECIDNQLEKDREEGLTASRKTADAKNGSSWCNNCNGVTSTYFNTFDDGIPVPMCVSCMGHKTSSRKTAGYRTEDGWFTDDETDASTYYCDQCGFEHAGPCADDIDDDDDDWDDDPEGVASDAAYVRYFYASRKTAGITPGYYLVGHAGNTIEGPFSSLVQAEARQPDVKAAAIEYKSGVEDPQWESMKAEAFPYGLNTVNGNRRTAHIDFGFRVCPECGFCGDADGPASVKGRTCPFCDTPLVWEDDENSYLLARRKVANQYVEKRGDKWVVTQKGTGKVLSTHDTKEKAEASFQAMMVNKHGGSRKRAAASDYSPQDWYAEAIQDGFDVIVKGDLVILRQSFPAGSNADYVRVDGDASFLMYALPQTRAGSIWGTTSDGVGGFSAIKNGVYNIKASGISKTFIKGLVSAGARTASRKTAGSYSGAPFKNHYSEGFSDGYLDGQGGNPFFHRFDRSDKYQEGYSEGYEAGQEYSRSTNGMTASRHVVAWMETAPGEEWTLQNLQGETGVVQYFGYTNSYEWFIWDSNNEFVEGGAFKDRQSAMDEVARRISGSSAVVSRKTAAHIFDETYRGVDIFKDDTHGEFFFVIGWPGESFGNLPDLDLAHEIIDFKIDREGVVASRRIANDMTDEQDENSDDAKDSVGQAASAVGDLAEVLARRQPLRHFAEDLDLEVCEVCGETSATTVILENDCCIECNGVNDLTWSHNNPPIGYFD